MVAFPALLSVAIVEGSPPPVSATVPVGDGVPLRETVTVSDWAVVMLERDGMTVTVVVIFAGAVTVTDAAPELLL
jgi:hypothetical protein